MVMKFCLYVNKYSPHCKISKCTSLLAHSTQNCSQSLLNAGVTFLNHRCIGLSLPTLWRHTGGAGVKLHALLPSALNGGQLSPSSPATWPMGQNGGTHWIWGWVDPRASLYVLEKRKTSCPSRASTPVHPALSQSLDWLCQPASSPESWYTAKYHSVKQSPHNS
jgi:hypothetical protein